MEPLSSLVQTWLDWDKDPQTRDEIIRLRDAGDESELEKRLRKRIQFGTAGLRGRMQAGFSCMNSLTVIQASQGLARFFQQSHSGDEPACVVLGHDARHNSGRFAALAANAFDAVGIKVWWYPTNCPTPHVPFGILVKHAAAGVMVTASHNPAHDNGYKVYYGNGAQINTPIDSQIAESIEQNLEPWESAWKPLSENKSVLVDDGEVSAAYVSRVHDLLASLNGLPLDARPFVYTPLHGVGLAPFSRLCHHFGVSQMTPVPEQRNPDPDFPTVKFPNPEEHGALDLAMQTADKLGRDLVLANDPDADRFAVAEKVNGRWHRFTGDQVGILFASYLIDAYQSTGRLDGRLTMLNTAVSSAMLATIATLSKFRYEETLTGFKWLANTAQTLERKNGLTIPYAYEEALGYMFTDVCYDKDGLTAACVFLAADAHLRREGLTPYAKLEELYQKLGYHESLNTYFISPSKESTAALFAAIRSRQPPRNNYLGTFPVVRRRDMTLGFDSGTYGGKPRLPPDASSEMVTIWTDKRARFTLRGSGTEPKVKIYIEASSASCDEAAQTVYDVFCAVRDDWVRPNAADVICAPEQVTSSGRVFRE